ncbi:T3SS (YopN, CesT) and YbjN peptide-binding chaperone 1 [Dermacoccus barathri]|uniref:YbjN domain-containing protein n=1 Tax=Dermacoccus barathri TaxID=322601 RepID=A0ABN2BHV2_9MICO
MTDPTALPNFGQPTPAAGGDGASASLTDKVVGVLNGFGFNPQIDSDGDVMYTVEDQNLFVRVMEGEIDLVRLFGQWQITDDITSDLAKRLNAANDVTLSLNIVKVGIARDMVVVSGEHLVTPDLDLQMVLPSTTQMILQATQLWHQSVNSDGPHAAEGGVPAFAQADGEQPTPEA